MTEVIGYLVCAALCWLMIRAAKDSPSDLSPEFKQRLERLSAEKQYRRKRRRKRKHKRRQKQPEQKRPTRVVYVREAPQRHSHGYDDGIGGLYL